MPRIRLNPESNCCLICGASDLIHFYADASDSEDKTTINITECKSCSFAWQYPFARSTQQSSKWFEDAYRDAGKLGSEYFLPERKLNIARLEFEFISQLPTQSTKRILDVGAGAGTFASMAARNNWNVTAVDPSLDVNQIATDKIKKFKGGIEKIPDNEHFDVITMWDVIEHAENPIDMIYDAMCHLDESGWIVIETGNYKSVARVIGGKSHWIYQLDHRWYFSPESITTILKDMGFTEFIYANKALRPGWAGQVEYVGPSRYQLAKSIISHPFKFKNHIATYRQLKNVTSWQMPGIEIFALAARIS